MQLNVILLLNLFTPKKLAFLAVLISLIALAIACYAVIRLLQEKEKNRYAANSKKDIDPSYLARIVVNSRQVRGYITATVQNVVVQEIKKANNNPSEAFVSRVSDVVLECIRLEENEKAKHEEVKAQQLENTLTTESPKTTKVVEAIYYATAVGEGNHTFYNVATEPTKGETIFKFTEVQKGRCEFEVFELAYNMVLKESGYLDGACTLDKLGNSKVITTKNGIAELNAEGQWVVKEPAKVKFE